MFDLGTQLQAHRRISFWKIHRILTDVSDSDCPVTKRVDRSRRCALSITETTKFGLLYLTIQLYIYLYVYDCNISIANFNTITIHINHNHINVLSQTQNHTFYHNSQSRNHKNILPRWTRTTSVTWLLTPQDQTPVSKGATFTLTTGFEPDSWSQTSGRFPITQSQSFTDNQIKYKTKLSLHSRD